MVTKTVRYESGREEDITARDIERVAVIATRHAKGESFEIVDYVATKKDRTLEKELALQEAIKYGCSVTKEMLE